MDGEGRAAEFQALHEIVEAAQARLDRNVWDFITGGAETETTLRRNRLALDTVALRPRVLVDVNGLDMGRDYYGRRSRLPVMLAPIGSLHAMGEGGAATTARAAGEFGIPVLISSASEPGLEGVAQAAPGACRIFQLYVRGGDDFVEDVVSRAIDNGYAGFCLTVDSAMYSRRERDIRNRYTPVARQAVSGRSWQAALDWKTVRLIKRKFNIPLMLKGIATAEDTALAVDHGVDWVCVSNHGGRQLDHGRGTIEMLPEVVEAARGRTRILIDGGFYRGADIVKALALGADAVGLGRLQCYAIAAAGKDGVLRMLEILEDEIGRALGQLGVRACAELGRAHVHCGALATALPDVLSAFPLLRPAGPAKG